MPKKGKYPADKSDSPMLYREARFEVDRANDEERSIPMVLASEDPIPTADLGRMEIVDEVLELDGMEVPASGKIPLLDTHNRDSVRNVLGSIRDIERDGKYLRAVAYFSEDAEDVYRAYRDGHLDSFSVGASIKRAKYTPRGEAQRTQKRVTSSALKEGSSVVFGADPSAKAEMVPALRAYTDPSNLLEEAMSDELKSLLVERGMPAETEGKDVLEWVQRNLKPEADDSKEEKSKYDDILRAVKDAVKPAKKEPELDESEVRRAEATRIKEIQNVCRKFTVEQEQIDKWIDEGTDANQVARELLEGEFAPSKPLGTVQVVGSSQDKVFRSMSEALGTRVLRGVDFDANLDRARKQGDFGAIERNEEVKRMFNEPSPEAKDLRDASVNEMARAYLDAAGVDYSRVKSPLAIMRMAVNHPGLWADEPIVMRSGYHSTGSFSNLLVDAANKTLLASYDEAETTYQMWVRTAPSAADLKALNRIKFGELGDPETIPEGGDYPEATTSDNKESYKVEKKGHTFSVTLETLINDDLNALSRLPAMQGAAFRRAINRDCYAILTANANLSDGNALFSSAHGNGSNVSINTAGLNAVYTALRTMSGLNSTTILNISPRYILVPAALEATALQFFASQADPSVGGDTTGSSGVQNIYGPNGSRRNLMVIADGQLDNNSSTIWYAAADNGQVDTVELCFLQGYEAPVTDQKEEFNNDTLKWKATQFWAAKAIDYRGLYRGGTTVS